MANTLSTLFQDIANAIRSKNGDTDKMKPIDFPEAILSIEGGGGSGGTGHLIPLTVTENGTYYPPKGTVEVGGTYTFKTAYTQEELKRVFDSGDIADDGVYSYLYRDDVLDNMLGIMYNAPYYGVYTSAEGLIWLPEAFTSQLGASEGWYQVTGDGGFAPYGETPIFTFNRTGESFIADLSITDDLFVLPEVADGFSSVAVNVQAQSEKPIPFVRLSCFTEVPEGAINKFVWHPNGTRLVITHTEGAWLYDTTTTPYTFIEVLENSTTSVAWGASYSPDGTRLVLMMGGTDSSKVTVRTYDTTTTPYTMLTNLVPSKYTSYSYFGQARWCDFSPNGEILCITGAEGYVIFDTTTTPYTVLKEANGIGQPNDIVFDESGTYLYIVCSQTLYTQTMGGYTFTFNSIRFKIGDDKTLTLQTSIGLSTVEETQKFALRGDRAIASWDVGRVLAVHDATSTNPSLRFKLFDSLTPWRYMAVDRTGQFVIGCNNNKVLTTAKITDDGILFYELAPDFSDTARTIQFSPDNKKLFVGTGNAPYVYVYDVSASI